MNDIVNPLLDGKFPDSYRGYKINTDFRVGIKLTLLSQDDSFDDEVKLLASFSLLYADKVPEDINVAVSGLKWFLSLGRSDFIFVNEPVNDDTTDVALDFNQDALDIWAEFIKLGYDLTIDNLHWFAFMSILRNINDCNLTKKMGYRTVDLKCMTGETKKQYKKLKEQYKIREMISVDEYNDRVKSLNNSGDSYYANLVKRSLRQ